MVADAVAQPGEAGPVVLKLVVPFLAGFGLGIDVVNAVIAGVNRAIPAKGVGRCGSGGHGGAKRTKADNQTAFHKFCIPLANGPVTNNYTILRSIDSLMLRRFA